MPLDFEILLESLQTGLDELNALRNERGIPSKLRDQIAILSGNMAMTVQALYSKLENLPDKDELETEAAVKQYMKDKLTEEDLSYLRLKFGMEAHEIYAI